MDAGELWTRWTVRLALALYVLSLVVRLLAHQRRRWLDVSRACWTLGCVAYLLHVTSAFAYYHHWSHAEAYAGTAQQTAAVTGLNWGGGLYANYFFTLLWCADVVWWWLGRYRYENRSWLSEVGVQGFLGFIAFNAAIVFGHGLIRWFGCAACVALLACWGYRWRSNVCR